METDDREFSLVQRAAAGDTVALKLLLTEIHPRLCAQVTGRIPAYLRRVIDPEDIVQEAEITVFRQMGAFQPRGPYPFYRWIATIALSRLRDVIRAEQAAKRGARARVLTRAGRKIEEPTVALLDTLAGPGNTPSRSVARGDGADRPRYPRPMPARPEADARSPAQCLPVPQLDRVGDRRVRQGTTAHPACSAHRSGPAPCSAPGGRGSWK